MTDAQNQETAVAATAAALLAQGGVINLLSCGLLLLGLGGLLAAAFTHQHPASLLAAGLACAGGFVQAGLAVRVGFDAAIFRHFAGVQSPRLEAPAFDLALQSLGLARGIVPGRPMASRAQGALRLLRLQAAACAGQGALLLVAIVLALALGRA